MRCFLKSIHKAFCIICVLVLWNFSAQAAPMVFSAESTKGNCIGCDWYQAEGEITKETPAVLQAFLDKRRDTDWKIVPAFLMQFNSSGGDLFAAMEVGRILRKEGIPTTVGSTIRHYGKEEDGWFFSEGGGWLFSEEGEEAECAGVCVFAYLGGRTHTGSGFRIKSYKPPLADMDKQDVSAQRKQELNEIAYILDYSREMGFDPSFIYSGKQDGSFYAIDWKEAEKLSLIFDADEFGKWQIEQRDGGLVAVSRSGNGEKWAEFYCDASGTPYFTLSYKKQLPQDPRGWNSVAADMEASIFNVDVVVKPENFSETEQLSMFKIALPGVDFSREDTFGIGFFPQFRVDADWGNVEIKDKTSMKLYGVAVLRQCLKR